MNIYVSSCPQEADKLAGKTMLNEWLQYKVIRANRENLIPMGAYKWAYKFGNKGNHLEKKYVDWLWKDKG